MKRKLTTLAAIGVAVAAAIGPARGDDPDPVPRALAVTVYNGNLGLVRDQRTLGLQSGIFTLPFRDVASQIDPTSVAFRALGHPGEVDVLEQNYEFDLLTPAALLEKYVGETVTLIMTLDGEERSVEAKLLSTQGGMVYQIGDSIALNPPGRVVLPALRGDLRSSPTLVWTLRSGRAGNEPVEVSYLTGGLTWKADYVVTLSEDSRRLDLGGWVTIDNRSGATYPDARLKLVAGDIHRAPQPTPQYAARMLAEAAAARDESEFQERTFYEYHLYDLPRPTTIKNNQTKQIRLLEGTNVRTEKVYVLAGAPWYYTQSYGGEQGLKVGVYQEFENDRDNGLGIALPAGTVRLYQADTDGTLQLVGEDRIDHTPRDERLRLKVGEAFDIVADRRQTAFDVITSGHVYEAAFEVVIRNHKDEAVTVQVIEPLPGDWELLSSSHSHRDLDAFTVRFDVPVEANGETTLRYRFRVRW
ncbi:MAG TPA: DUF4139 domain-containing protein, partial [Gemmatimonadota bacterium]|nr:DUF4139 domain-containing protein [Gemmatimonadota bacterium]